MNKIDLVVSVRCQSKTLHSVRDKCNAFVAVCWACCVAVIHQYEKVRIYYCDPQTYTYLLLCAIPTIETTLSLHDFDRASSDSVVN